MDTASEDGDSTAGHIDGGPGPAYADVRAAGMVKGNPQFRATTKPVSPRSLRALDFANLFLSDVRDGIGPYLGVYLVASHHWDAGSVGVAMAAMGFATVIAQTPAGALIDRTRHKKLVVATATLVVALACIGMTWFVTLPAIVAFQALIGVAAALLMPGVAALTLGLVGYRKYPARQGRNEVFNHAGNVMAALLAGALAHYLAREWLFYAVALFAIGSLVALVAIRREDIDDDLARGAKMSFQDTGAKSAPGYAALLRNRTLMVFAAAAVLFHFANAAMLPLVGQYMTVAAPDGAALYMSACIIAAQLVMIPVAKMCGMLADTWGRRPLFLIGFAVLPLRGVLYTLSHDPYWLVGVQALDGIGAGIFGVLWVIVVADLTRGSGRYNLALGAIATIVGIGASASNLVAGYVVNATSYSGGFLFLAAVAVAAFVVYWAFVPETRPSD